MDSLKEFQKGVDENIRALGQDSELRRLSIEWNCRANSYNYCHNFNWMGMPVIQAPQDLVAMQEIIWNVKPEVIFETGIALGGSLIFYASMLEMMRIDGQVLGVDIDIRTHNYERIVQHPMYKRISLLEGSSVEQRIADKVRGFCQGKKSVLVCLDSNHTHEHVLKELQLYAPLVTVGSYCVVFDTGIEDMPASDSSDRSWGPGDNPKTAVWEYLKTTDRFEIDKTIENKIMITAAPDGYLKRVR